MIAVPFIYFSILTFLLLRRRKSIDIASLITAMFAVSGFFSILIDAFGLRYGDSVGYRISLGATVVYCGLLSLCIAPIIFNRSVSVVHLRPVKSSSSLKVLAYIAFVWFCVLLFMSWKGVIDVLTGDMAEARLAMYQGEGGYDWMSTLPPLLRFIVAVLNSFFGCKWALIFLAFFSLYVQKLPKKFFFLFLVSSLSGPINGILGADRSATAYWILSLLAVYILFSPIIDKQNRKRLLFFSAVIVGVLAVYLGMMTIARFAERDYGSSVTGTQGGLISYLGQSFINFCVYFDTYDAPITNLGIIFPFIFKHILGQDTGGVIIQQQMAMLTHFETGVFYTFIGQIIMGAGKVVAVIYCIVYTIVSAFALSFYSRQPVLRASNIYLYFAISSILFLGIFVHYYTADSTTFGLVMMYIVLRMIE